MGRLPGHIANYYSRKYPGALGAAAVAAHYCDADEFKTAAITAVRRHMGVPDMADARQSGEDAGKGSGAGAGAGSSSGSGAGASSGGEGSGGGEGAGGSGSDSGPSGGEGARAPGLGQRRYEQLTEALGGDGGGGLEMDTSRIDPETHEAPDSTGMACDGELGSAAGAG